MTLEEAIKVLGVAFAAVLLETPGTAPIRLQLYHAIIEEWLDGNLDTVQDAIPTLERHGSTTFQQAMRVVANKIDIYGDVS